MNWGFVWTMIVIELVASLQKGNGALPRPRVDGSYEPV